MTTFQLDCGDPSGCRALAGRLGPVPARRRSVLLTNAALRPSSWISGTRSSDGRHVIRLRLFERVALNANRRSVAVVALVAAGASSPSCRAGGDELGTDDELASTREPTCTISRRPRPRAGRGCSMYIRFTWRPELPRRSVHRGAGSDQAAGTTIEGMYRKTLRHPGVSLELGPIPFAGGYQVLVGESSPHGPRSARERHDDPRPRRLPRTSVAERGFTRLRTSLAAADILPRSA